MRWVQCAAILLEFPQQLSLLQPTKPQSHSARSQAVLTTVRDEGSTCPCLHQVAALSATYRITYQSLENNIDRKGTPHYRDLAASLANRRKCATRPTVLARCYSRQARHPDPLHGPGLNGRTRDGYSASG